MLTITVIFFWSLRFFLRQWLNIFPNFKAAFQVTSPLGASMTSCSYLFRSIFSLFMSVRLHSSRQRNWIRLRLHIPAISSQNIFGNSFICLTCPSQRWRSIVSIVGSPHLDSTTVFGVLLVQDIPRKFLSERIWKILNVCSSAELLSSICFRIKVY